MAVRDELVQTKINAQAESLRLKGQFISMISCVCFSRWRLRFYFFVLGLHCGDE